jgi:hypothetical protein
MPAQHQISHAIDTQPQCQISQHDDLNIVVVMTTTEQGGSSSKCKCEMMHRNKDRDRSRQYLLKGNNGPSEVKNGCSSIGLHVAPKNFR